MEPFPPIPPPTPSALATAAQVYGKLQQAFTPAVDRFEESFRAWKATWHTPEMELEASAAARANGPQFDHLVQLGPPTVPLIVHKLAEPDNFFAAWLYNAVEQDSNVKVDPTNVLDYNVLQRHANLIIDMNHVRASTFASHVRTWRQYQDELLSANSKDYLDHQSYRSIVQMGPGIIGYVFQEYVDEPGGWWHELLHEIVHGRTSGAGTFFKDRLYAEWKAWFEEGRQLEEAPKGR